MEFNIPPLVTEELWLKANQATRERGRGRGKQGKVIAALLRNRIFCPRCGRPLLLRRRSGGDKFYYLCSRLTHASLTQHCSYRRFIPGTWDTTVWDCVYALLKQDGWIQEQLSAMGKQNHNIDKLVKLEQHKILLCQTKMAKVREGFEGGLYNLNEAKSKVDGYQDTINRAEQEIKRLMGLTEGQNSKVNVEDLKTMKTRCSLNFRSDGNCQPSDRCAIVRLLRPRLPENLFGEQVRLAMTVWIAKRSLFSPFCFLEQVDVLGHLN